MEKSIRKGSVGKHANTIARREHSGRATSIIFGTCDRVVSHDPYGVVTPSGRFFPGMTHTYPGRRKKNGTWCGECYTPARTVVEIVNPRPDVILTGSQINLVEEGALS